MKIFIRNKSKKPKSRKRIKDLKEYTQRVCKRLGVRNIKEIRITFRTDFHGYYLKGKPLAGFKKLYNKGIVKIDLARHWDASIKDNHMAIIHELTHVRQMQLKKMIIGKDQNSIKWNGKTNYSWKWFDWEVVDNLEGNELSKYIAKHLPWEKEVQHNIETLIWKI